jgi:DNA-binding transcriptional MerR regulator
MAKKLYYKIGDACRELDVQPYVLRYWETEFPFLRPDKSRSGQRVYSEKELALIARVKTLLYDEGYTIAGAKKRIEAELESGKQVPLLGEAADGEIDAKTGNEAEATEARLDTPEGERIEHIALRLRTLSHEAREILALIKR